MICVYANKSTIDLSTFVFQDSYAYLAAEYISRSLPNLVKHMYGLLWTQSTVMSRLLQMLWVWPCFSFVFLFWWKPTWPACHIKFLSAVLTGLNVTFRSDIFKCWTREKSLPFPAVFTGLLKHSPQTLLTSVKTCLAKNQIKSIIVSKDKLFHGRHLVVFQCAYPPRFQAVETRLLWVYYYYYYYCLLLYSSII